VLDFIWEDNDHVGALVAASPALTRCFDLASTSNVTVIVTVASFVMIPLDLQLLVDYVFVMHNDSSSTTPASASHGSESGQLASKCATWTCEATTTPSITTRIRDIQCSAAPAGVAPNTWTVFDLMKVEPAVSYFAPANECPSTS
jgi:hypothetical protein